MGKVLPILGNNKHLAPSGEHFSTLVSDYSSSLFIAEFLSKQLKLNSNSLSKLFD